jgi:hypothetical protein
MSHPARAPIIAAVLLVTACRSAPPVTVTITAPADEATIMESAVPVTLAVSGIELAPVAEQRPGTAHHHLYLDQDLGSPTEPIPVGIPGIVHLGQAQTGFQWDSVAPGPHRIIAILADPAHRPLVPSVTDTVHFVVARAP